MFYFKKICIFAARNIDSMQFYKVILEKQLLKSLFTEEIIRKENWILNETRNMLVEKHGVLPDMWEYTIRFVNYLKSIKDKEGTFHLNNNIFQTIPNCFFNNVDITIRKKKRNVSNGLCVIENLKLADNGKIETLEMNFSFGDNWLNTISDAQQLFSHEITHAYEGWQRLVKGGINLHDEAIRNKYSNVVQSQKFDKSVLNRKIGYILYYLFQFETNAYIASLYGFLKPYSYSWKTPQEGYDIIKNNVTFNNYAVIGQWIEELSSCENHEEVENAWRDSGRSKMSYNSIIKKLKVSYSKRWNQLRKVVSKLLYDLYEEAKNNVLDEEIIWNNDLKIMF